NLHKSYLLAFYTADEGQAQISALHLIEAREVKLYLKSCKENSSRKNPRDLQAAKFFQVMVDPAAVFVCFLQASSEECVCKLALA
ncbi:hypothetical protein IGI04_009583, partial [Brassica rapa subsp. trilocularis]